MSDLPPPSTVPFARHCQGELASEARGSVGYPTKSIERCSTRVFPTLSTMIAAFKHVLNVIRVLVSSCSSLILVTEVI